ncbi:MAG: type II CAAX endopeptidase family protein [Rhodospirillaceae bacterium]|nr:type II CAAX endopeptidase family protein [Rhodospirillaceae bacterium]MDD9918019.1 type II CAAX endopeptidase family protein [Rhodospirillaceae bacterium]
MLNDTLPNNQAAMTAISGRQTLAVFLVGSLGIAIGYFGLPRLVSNGFVQLESTLLHLIADGLAYGGFLVAAWIFVVKPRDQGLKALGLKGCEVSFFVLAGFLAVLWIIVSSLLYSIMGVWEAALIYGAGEVAPYQKTYALLVGLFLLAGPIAALTEEILFRGILYTWLRRHLNVTIAALLSAFLFTIAHPSVFVGGVAAILDTSLLAILLALLFEVSRSLWPGILAHALYNTLLLSHYLYQG